MQIRTLFSAALLSGLVYLSAGLAHAAEERYRVSGIIMTPEKQIAVVEKSDGSQQLYKQGDMIDGFVVEHVDSDGIFLNRSGSKIFLELEGTPSLLGDGAATLRTSELQVSAGRASQNIDYGRARLELAKLSRAQTNSESLGSENGRSGNRQATLEERLNMALGLPSYTAISSIDRDKVERPEDAVSLLAQKVSRGDSVRLEVDGSIPGVHVLYLAPQNSPSDNASSP